ncbi:hypothetical protein FUAX_33150 [Fulvitalea axinellae]|uniref:Uncharacterized protein n=1 Tax=Fulvitalea axinellae TaxID=1182444 RepID=A0AAU9D4H7_9BACT|nr:hypothetical protein FUAX_33150 [Fulvitalea axinellae]
MPEKRTLEIHTFQLLDEDKEALAFSTLNNDGLFTHIKNNLLNYFDSIPRDEHNKQVIKVSKKEEGARRESVVEIDNDKRYFMGKVGTGYYGKREEVNDTESDSDEPAFTIDNKHAVIKPFFYMIVVPALRNKGFILLERIGNFGIKGIFEKCFKKYVTDSFSAVASMKWENFVDEEIVEKYLRDGELNSISFTQNNIPYDSTARHEVRGGFETNEYTLELSIKAKGKDKVLPSFVKDRVVRNAIDSNIRESISGFFEVSPIENPGFGDETKIKVNSRYNSKDRVVNLSDTMKFRPYYEVFIDVESSGHSDFNSICEKAIELFESYDLPLTN